MRINLYYRLSPRCAQCCQSPGEPGPGRAPHPPTAAAGPAPGLRPGSSHIKSGVWCSMVDVWG